MHHDISFDDINPYVRYCHYFSPPPIESYMNICSYDYRLFYIVAGRGTIKIGETHYLMRPGALLLWGPGLIYSILSEQDAPFAIYGINFDYTRTARQVSHPVSPRDCSIFSKDDILDSVFFTDLDFMNRSIWIENAKEFEQSIIDMTTEFLTQKRFASQIIHGSMITLLAGIARKASLSKSSSDSGVAVVDQLIKYINDHYQEELTNETLGELFNYHPVYINRLMVQHTGMPLHQYVLRYRISAALTLLQSGTCTVAEAAVAAGFNDPNYFSRCFKKHMGVSPKEYRTKSIFSKPNPY